MKRMIVSILVSALLLSSCSSSSSATDLDVAGFANQIIQPNVTILDVRTPSEFMAGHIEGAINIDVEGELFESGIANLDKSKTYAIYCQSGRRSQIAADEMSSAGFRKLSNLEDGINSWLTEAKPLVS